MDDKLVAKALEYLQSAETFILTEAPDVIQQILRYKTISCWIGFYSGLFFMTVSLLFFVYFWYNPTYEKHLNSSSLTTESFVARIICIVISFLSFIAIVSNLESLIKITFAPKMFLIEYLMNLKS